MGSVFTSLHIAADQSSAYADIFIENCITEGNLTEFQQLDLQELGLTAFQDIKNIPKRTQSLQSSITSSTPLQHP